MLLTTKFAIFILIVLGTMPYYGCLYKIHSLLGKFNQTVNYDVIAQYC